MPAHAPLTSLFKATLKATTVNNLHLHCQVLYHSQNKHLLILTILWCSSFIFLIFTAEGVGSKWLNLEHHHYFLKYKMYVNIKTHIVGWS